MGKADVPEAVVPGEASPGEATRHERAALLRRVLQQAGLLGEEGASETRSPQRVVPLGGGADASAYLVRCTGRDVVVKLNDQRVEAEASALRAWRAHTRMVPEVLGVGRVPGRENRPVKYLVLQALVNDDGDVVETAAEYLERVPHAARDVGRALGAELHRLHQARRDTGFGDFADSPGAERTYRTWNSYLVDYFMQHADYVRTLGVPDRQIDQAAGFIRGCRYVDEARYLHGDVSIRNVAMRGYDPVSISLFDPNPLGGDPSWDLGPITNNAELSRRRQATDGGAPEAATRDRELLLGFWDSYPQVIAEEALLTARLVQGVVHAEHRDAASDDEHDDRDVAVAHELIRELIDRMST